jgi:hypothetical protein
MKKSLILSLLVTPFITQADPCHYSQPHVLFENNHNITYHMYVNFHAWNYDLTSTPCVEGTGYDDRYVQAVVAPNSSEKRYLVGNYNPFDVVEVGVTPQGGGTTIKIYPNLSIWSCSNNCPNNLNWSAIKVKMTNNGTLEAHQRD